MILGVTVTYGNRRPDSVKTGDRWYFSPEKQYYIAGPEMDIYFALATGRTRWGSVGSKRFFDLSDIQN